MVKFYAIRKLCNNTILDVTVIPKLKLILTITILFELII
jgi:hypothetical protein